MRRVMLSAASMLVAASGITVASAPQAGATASCTSNSSFTDSVGHQVFIPTIGSQTHQDNCQLGLGNDNNGVASLQYALNGCYAAKLTVDGNYGPLTEAAVKHAQSVEHITVDGIYGPQTRDHIKWDDILGTCARL
jgi:peptidoglycan hydrolase-like protein with peptidoglycan-binding domain